MTCIASRFLTKCGIPGTIPIFLNNHADNLCCSGAYSSIGLLRTSPGPLFFYDCDAILHPGEDALVVINEIVDSPLQFDRSQSRSVEFLSEKITNNFYVGLDFFWDRRDLPEGKRMVRSDLLKLVLAGHSVNDVQESKELSSVLCDTPGCTFLCYLGGITAGFSIVPLSLEP
jgi:hypothetical protein